MSGEGMIANRCPVRSAEAAEKAERAAVVDHLRCKRQALDGRLAQERLGEADIAHARTWIDQTIEEIESGMHRPDQERRPSHGTL